jgi:nucleotide-binding universal stress UspA family protein
MHSPSKILVPVDFTDSSRAALEYAATLGARLGAEIDVLHVWQPPRAAGSEEELLVEFERSDAGHKMMEWLVSLELRSDVEPHGRLATGVRSGVPDAIVAAAESGAYDLVVMATHGRQGLSLLFRSSVTEKVVSRAPCPVVTLRATEQDGLPGAGDRGDLAVTGAWSWPS